MGSPLIIGVLLLYLAAMVAIGIWASRGAKDVVGYYVAGKSLPNWVIAFTTNATGESAWLLLGLTGMGYAVGIHAFWIVLGEVIGVCLAWVLVARPFKEYTDRFDSITVSDFLEDRYRDTAKVIRRVSVVIVFTMVAAYLAAQLTAAGKAFNSFLGLNYTTGVILGTAIVLFYTVTGGFKAVAYTDFLQGVIMLICLVLLPIVGIAAAGGWTNMIETLRAADPNLLTPMGSFGVTLPGIISVVSFVMVGLAFLAVPQLLRVFMAAKSIDEMPSASLASVLCIVGFDVGAVLAGMSGRAVFPGLTDTETILPVMADQLFPAIMTGLFLVAVLAAIMSTADALVIMASATIVRDVVQKIYQPFASESRLTLYARITTVVVGLAALIVALGEVRVIFWFVLFAWSGLASAFVPPVLCGLFWKRTTLPGAIAGMSTGFLASVIWVVQFKSAYYDLYEMVPGVIVGVLTTVVVSLLTTPPAGVDEEFDSVWATVGRPLRRPTLSPVPEAERPPVPVAPG